MNCTRCDGTGFLNAHQLPEDNPPNGIEEILAWIEANDDHDVQVCDCCGDGESWYGTPGEEPIGDDLPDPQCIRDMVWYAS